MSSSPALQGRASPSRGALQGRTPGAGFSLIGEVALGAMQAPEDRSLPPTPRSPSPTCSPPLSPKRQRSELTPAQEAASLAAEDDLESRA